MIPELGHFCLMLALSLTVLPILGYLFPKIETVIRGIILGQAFFIQLSVLCLAYAFVYNDFTVQYVAQHSNSALPWGYKLAALWSAHEGSVLLWVWVLSLWSLVAAYTSRALPSVLTTRMLMILSLLQMGFLIFLLQLSNPFLRIWQAPLDGRDLNPLLQDIGLILHPPMLYIGLIGFAVPFAFSMAVLSLSREQQERHWTAWLKPFVRGAWCFLTVGIILGSWWAYYELGWGGWWFWDPVENASFMPWLVATALLHTFALRDKHPNFTPWFLILSLATFCLSLLGTFLVRSGMLTSVHSFAVDPARGQYMLGFLSVTLAATLGFVVTRLPRWTHKRDQNLLAWRSLPGLLLIQNALFVVLCGTVLLGTLFPLAYEALTNQKISVGFPYFNQVFVPLSLPLFLLMGIAGLTVGRSVHSGWIFSIIALLAGIWVSVFFPPVHPEWPSALKVILGVALSIWLLLSCLKACFPYQRRYLGMVVAHLGVAVCVLGVTINTQYSVERELKIKPGDTVVLNQTPVTFDSVDLREGPNYLTYKAQFKVNNTSIYPEKRLFTAQATSMTETALQVTPWRDIYVALGERLDTLNWSARLYYKPFVRWIWAGGLLMVLGGLLGFGAKRWKHS